MIVALYISLALIVVGSILYFLDRTPKSPQPSSENAEAEVCCGLHEICEKIPAFTEEIEYFDDEELDQYIGREADQYTPQETEEFRDVLLTLRSEETASWAQSIERRGIKLPTEIRDELLIILSDNH